MVSGESTISKLALKNHISFNRLKKAFAEKVPGGDKLMEMALAVD